MYYRKGCAHRPNWFAESPFEILEEYVYVYILAKKRKLF